MHLVGISAGLDRYEARGIRHGQRGERCRDPRVVLGTAAADCVYLPFIPQRQTPGRLIGRDLQEDCSVRQQTCTADPVQGLDGVDAKQARCALICEAGVDKPVADNPLACGQRRPDDPCYVVRPGGREQKGFRFRTPRLVTGRMQQELADRFGSGGSPGLTRQHHLHAFSLEPTRKQARLSGLAAPFPAFDADEPRGDQESQPATPFTIRRNGPARSILAPAFKGML